MPRHLVVKNDSLQIYLHDHLAGAALAIDMLKALRDGHNDGLGEFAAGLLGDIETDLQELRKLAARIETRSAGFKEWMARLMERLSRLKFRRGKTDDLGTFETLEALALGILGKAALWTALSSVDDSRLMGLDYPVLIRRARQQHERAEQMRLKLAQAALGR